MTEEVVTAMTTSEKETAAQIFHLLKPKSLQFRNLGLTRETARRFVERYVLTVLWYQLNGPQWSYQVKFMSPQDHCNWFDQLVTTSGNMVREGVLCNNDGYIIAINLGKQMKDRLINLSTSFFPYNRCVA